MRFAIAFALLVLILPACKGEKGDTGAPGANGAPAPNNQAELLVFEGTISGDPMNVFVGTVGDDQVVLAYFALSALPDRWIQLAYPTGDNAIDLDPWFSINATAGVVSLFNCENGDRYKIFVIPVNMLSSFNGLARLER